jgi:DNA-binding transcriptional LysR family regulator
MNKYWADFPILLAVAETGSLTAAGDKLGVSQPTAGRRIRALEDYFGAPLLTKEGNQLVPTAFGHTILARIKNMRDEADAIERARAGADQDLAGTVRISGTEGIGDLWLPYALQGFHEKHPETRIEAIVDQRSVNLARREADIAIRWVGPGNQNSLIGRKVIAAGFGLYAAQSYIQKRGRPMVPEDIHQHDGVMVTLNNTDHFWPELMDTPERKPGHIAFRSNSFHAQSHALIAGYGVGFFAHFSWPAGLQPKPIERVLPKIDFFEDLWVVAHEDLRKSARIRIVYDYVVKALQDDRAYFETGTPSKFSRNASGPEAR